METMFLNPLTPEKYRVYDKFPGSVILCSVKDTLRQVRLTDEEYKEYLAAVDHSAPDPEGKSAKPLRDEIKALKTQLKESGETVRSLTARLEQHAAELLTETETSAALKAKVAELEFQIENLQAEIDLVKPNLPDPTE